MKLRYLFMSLLAGAALLSSCSDTLEIARPEGIDVPQSYVTMPSGVTTASTKITVDGSWTASSADSWLSVSPASGEAGTYTLNINAADSDTRVGYVTVTCGKASQRITVNQIGLVVPGSKDTPYTATEAYNIIKSGKIPVSEVYVKGIITNILELSVEWGNATFFISDDGSEDSPQFEIYRVKYLEGAPFTSEDQLGLGWTIVAKGIIKDYKGTPEMDQGGTLISVTPGEPFDDGSVTITEVLALADNETFSTKNAFVSAITTKGFVATDAKGAAIYVYNNGVPAVTVGDKVSFGGTKSTSNGIPQVTKPTDIKVAGSGNKITYPDAKDITATFDTYTATTPEFVTFEGVLSAGAYTNVTVEGATVKGSLVNPVDALGTLSDLNGKKVIVKGYYTGNNTSGENTYLNVIATSVKAAAGGGGEETTKCTTLAEIVSKITSTDRANPSPYEAKLATPAVVSYVNGSNVFMQDASGGLLLYKGETGLKPGDTVGGEFSGTGYMYSALPEITSFEGATIGTGTAPAPKVVTIAELKANFNKYISTLVKVEGVTINADAAGTGKTNVEIAQGGETMTLRTQVNAIKLTKGSTGDVIVIPTIFNTTMQLGLWEQDNFIAK